MQSAPERPGAVEVAFLLRGGDDEDDLVGLRCYASAHREDGHVVAKLYHLK